MKVGKVWISRCSMTVDRSGSSRKQFLEVADHDVRPVMPQRLGISGSRDPDHQSEAASLFGLHAGNGVLDHNGTPRLDPELPGRCQEHVGFGLPRQAQIDGGLPVYTDLEER